MDYATGDHQHQDEPNFYRPADALAPNSPQPTAQPLASVPTPTAVDHTQLPDTPNTYIPPAGAITWTASEYIDHQKTASWYVMLGVAAVIVSVLVWLLARDIFPAVAVFVGIVLLGVYSARKPQQQTYALDDRGITIGARHYLYGDFRSFSIVPEGAFLSVELTPTKRFATYASMYFDPADEDRILERLSQYVPMQEHSASLADSVMRRIRF